LAHGADFSNFNFFQPPLAFQWERKQSPGVRFAGMSAFRGDNRPFGARMTAYIPEVEEKKAQKLRVDYTNTSGDTLYTQYHKVEKAGLHHWRWAMWEKGTHYPEFKVREEKKEESDPRGAPVVPGTYTVWARWGDRAIEQSLVVHPDHRMDEWMSQEDYEARRAAFKRIEGIELELDVAVQQLAQANENIERLQALIKSEPYKSDSTLQDTAKATAKAMEAVRLNIFGKKETKGYFEEPQTWSSTWNGSLWQLLSSSRAWETNEEALYDQVKDRTSEAVHECYDFLRVDYEGLKQYLVDHPVDRMLPVDAQPE
jgi:hypothetical protein